MVKGNVTNEMAAGRILSHGKIADLTSGFSLPNLIPFSVFIVPTGVGIEHGTVLVNCALYQDNESSVLPINSGNWCEAGIVEIATNAIDLTSYDVYWGSGYSVEN